MSRSEIFAGAATRGFAARIAGVLSGFSRNWLTRHRLKDLDTLDDVTLRDIGVSRGDIIWAQHLPLAQDPLQELSKVAKRRYR